MKHIMHHIKQLIFGLTLMLGLSIFAAPAMAAPVDVFKPACNVSGSNTSVCPQSGDKGLFPTIRNIINILLVIAGIVAVVMIIVAGLSYILSNGEQNRITIAKNTILYAVVGLVITITAFAIVNFVIARI